MIVPADKGNATVIMDTNDYNRKMEALLDPDTYQIKTRDPTSGVERKTIQLIKQMNWDQETVKQIQPAQSRPPRLYGLPKIHKPEVPLRPIVSAIDSPTYKLAKHLASLLQPHVGNTEHHVKNSRHFVEILGGIHLNSNDILVSFDVESLFTKVPVGYTLELLKEKFDANLVALFEHCLTSTYFVWQGTFYEQKEGMAMGSPLSPVVANFFMEEFEQKALRTAQRKPKHWFRYVDDTFVIWPHGEEELHNFLEHLNEINSNIKLTMEMETDQKLPFLDVLVTRKSSGTLGHSVYRKPTHTDRYLQANSNHHPGQKRAVIKTLVDRAKAITEAEYLSSELRYLAKALQANGFGQKDIQRAIRPKRQQEVSVLQEEEQPEVQQKAFLPYVQGVTDRIAKVLKGKNIKTTFVPTTKVGSLLRSVKEPVDPLHTPGIYKIPCECGKVYIGQTTRTIKQRKQEHQRHLRLLQPERSALAEHSIREDHKIRFDEVEVLARPRGYYNQVRREAVEIIQHPNNLNREDGFRLSRTWLPVLSNRQTGQHPPVEQVMAEVASAIPPTNQQVPRHPPLPPSSTRRVTRAMAAQFNFAIENVNSHV